MTRVQRRTIDLYITRHRATYRAMADSITPDTGQWGSVWTRAAFAILSANTHFDAAVAALEYCNRHRGKVDAGLLRYRMIPAKVGYVNALPLGEPVLALTRQPAETFHAHRLRIRASVPGLGLCKASFFTALLEPLTADVACIDTHMQKVYLGHSSRDISDGAYFVVEGKVRRVGKEHGVSTFLAQWAIWDYARGVITSHAVFPE